jgi:hypothetical protein
MNIQQEKNNNEIMKKKKEGRSSRWIWLMINLMTLSVPQAMEFPKGGMKDE